MVELAQQRRLPPVHDIGTDGADIRDGQHQQQLKPFGRLCPLYKAANRLGVTDVELECGAAHQEMPTYQPRDGFGLLVRKPQPRAELYSDLFADLRVITAPALGDV